MLLFLLVSCSNNLNCSSTQSLSQNSTSSVVINSSNECTKMNKFESITDITHDNLKSILIRCTYSGSIDPGLELEGEEKDRFYDNVNCYYHKEVIDFKDEGFTSFLDFLYSNILYFIQFNYDMEEKNSTKLFLFYYKNLFAVQNLILASPIPL